MKKRLFSTLLALLVAALACSPRQPPDEQRTLATLRQVDEHPLFVMTYYGDYGFAEFLEHGWRAPQRRLDAFGRGAGSSQSAPVPAWASTHGVETAKSTPASTHGVETAKSTPACTCFWTLNPEGAPLFGRNFDWELHPALLLFTDPPDGYASVSMVDAAYLGLGSQPLSESERRKFLDAPYWPFDGMNECGVAVGIMAVPAAETPRDPARVTIGSLHAVRLVLDQAGDVEQAISLLGQYNLEWGGGPPLHYLLSDRGASAVVEFVRGKMRVLRNTDLDERTSTNSVEAHTTRRQDGTKSRAGLDETTSTNSVEAHTTRRQDGTRSRAGLDETTSTNSVEAHTTRRQDGTKSRAGRWQVATNFLLSEVGAASPDDLCPRYREANATLTRTAGQLSSDEAMALLGRVSQDNTQWSALYDLRSGDVKVAMGRAYGRVHEFGLGMR